MDAGRLARFVPVARGRVIRLLSGLKSRWANRQQRRNIVALAGHIRAVFPPADFAVCGADDGNAFPDFIEDLRTAGESHEANVSRSRRAARSHVVIGVLGSHLTLAESVCGGCVELVPCRFWRNIMTVGPVLTKDPRMALFLNRFLPVTTSSRDLADVVISMITDYEYFSCAFAFPREDDAPVDARALERILTARREALAANKVLAERYYSS